MNGNLEPIYYRMFFPLLESSISSRGVAQVVLGRTLNPEILSSAIVPRLFAPDDFLAIVKNGRKFNCID